MAYLSNFWFVVYSFKAATNIRQNRLAYCRPFRQRFW